jgi:hypothetical protein
MKLVFIPSELKCPPESNFLHIWEKQKIGKKCHLRSPTRMTVQKSVSSTVASTTEIKL